MFGDKLVHLCRLRTSYMHSAVSNFFPEVIRKGCRFYIGLKIQEEKFSVGVSTVFYNKYEIRKCLKYFLNQKFNKQIKTFVDKEDFIENTIISIRKKIYHVLI